jgi:hypothetical protein
MQHIWHVDIYLLTLGCLGNKHVMICLDDAVAIVQS